MLRRAVVAGALFALAFGSALSSAGAAPADPTHFDVQDDFVDSEACAGVTILGHVDIRGVLLVTSHGRDGLLHFSITIHARETFTNADTGTLVVTEANHLERDLRVTDNRDGTLTIVFATPGVLRLEDGDGHLLALNTGTTWYEVLIDHGGTPSDPSDDVFISQTAMKQTGLRDVDQDVFCAALV